MITITTSSSVQVKQGPQVSIPPIETQVEAYDKIDVSIEQGANIEVDVQPGDTGVSFLLLISNIYTPPDAPDGKKLTYTPEGKSAVSLEAPQLYLGASSINTLLGAVKKITFSNQLESQPEEDSPTANIAILVGRDATP